MTTSLRFARQAAALAVALLLPALAGCDTLGLGGSTWSGVVVDAATGEPLEGIHVSLQVGGGGFGAYTMVEVGVTNRDGEFRLHTSRHDTSLFVNEPLCYGAPDCPVDTSYGGAGPLLRGTGELRVEL